MKIAIPCDSALGLNSMRSGHFGHAPYFTIIEYDKDMNIVGTEPVKNLDHDEFGCAGIIRFVMALEVDGILTAGMGMPPFMQFTEAGIDVYVDARTPIVGDADRVFAEGKVPRMSVDDVCNHQH